VAIVIVVTIDLVSAIHPSRSKELGRMYITNDGVGTAERSSYDVAVCRRGTTTVPNPVDPLGPQPTRRGRVEDYPREAYNVWRLIARALLSAFPEESRASAAVLEHARLGGVRDTVAKFEDGKNKMARERDELRAENERLRADFAKLAAERTRALYALNGGTS
jgi:hypothetical protein